MNDKLMESYRAEAWQTLAENREIEHEKIKSEKHTDKEYENALYQHLYNDFDRVFEPLVEQMAELKMQFRVCLQEFMKSKPVMTTSKVPMLEKLIKC